MRRLGLPIEARHFNSWSPEFVCMSHRYGVRFYSFKGSGQPPVNDGKTRVSFEIRALFAIQNQRAFFEYPCALPHPKSASRAPFLAIV